MLALWFPSTSTFNVPSGNFINCRIVDKVPTVYRSLIFGSSSCAFFCATSMICLSPAIAACKATMDFSLPTKRGVTTEGKITTSLRGKSGIFFVFFPDIIV